MVHGVCWLRVWNTYLYLLDSTFSFPTVFIFSPLHYTMCSNGLPPFIPFPAVSCFLSYKWLCHFSGLHSLIGLHFLQIEIQLLRMTYKDFHNLVTTCLSSLTYQNCISYLVLHDTHHILSCLCACVLLSPSNQIAFSLTSATVTCWYLNHPFYSSLNIFSLMHSSLFLPSLN